MRGETDLTSQGTCNVSLVCPDTGCSGEDSTRTTEFSHAWRVEKHPRFVADLTGDRRADIVGFGDAGVWTALGNGDGTFQPPRFVLNNFGYQTRVIM